VVIDGMVPCCVADPLAARGADAALQVLGQRRPVHHVLNTPRDLGHAPPVGVDAADPRWSGGVQFQRFALASLDVRLQSTADLSLGEAARYGLGVLACRSTA